MAGVVGMGVGVDERLDTVARWLAADVPPSLGYLRARVARCASKHARSLRDGAAVGGSALDARRAQWAGQDAGTWLKAYVLVARDLGVEFGRPELSAVLQHAIASLPPDDDVTVPGA